MLKAREIMKTQFTSVKPEMTVEELGRLFMETNNTGFPVVTDDGSLYGVVTEHDLVRQNMRLHIPTVMRIFDAFIPIPSSMEEEVRIISGRTVADICSKSPVSVTEDTPLDEIATLMVDNKIHHIPVLADGKLKGIVSQRDIIKGLSR